ncbi:MAG: AI-2E family transporter [Endomicrobiaceae bacterium]|nr:AI-2E family transporter [Endomicrobiaceae bacterium]
MHEKTTIDISTRTFLKIIGIIAVFIFFYLIIDILAFIFLAFVISSAFKPIINFLENRKIPKLLSILIVYLSFIGVLIFVLVMVIQPMAVEVGQFAEVFPDYYAKLQTFLSRIDIRSSSDYSGNIQNGLAGVSGVLNQTVNSLLTKTMKVFGGIFSFITVIIMSFYFSTQENVIRKFLKSIVPVRYHDYFVNLNSGVEEKLGKWFRGQIFLCIIIFCLTFAVLLLFGIKYALILAIIAGVFEIIPSLGPWFSGILAVILTFAQSPTKALIVAICYFGIQQLENSFIVPKIMGSSTGLNPLVIMIGILVGFKVGGVLGGLIAVPIIATLSVFVLEYFNKKPQNLEKTA